jgi:hypothetical protein
MLAPFMSAEHLGKHFPVEGSGAYICLFFVGCALLTTMVFRMQDVKIKLAQAYGYCWGVERAVQMAYEARKQYPGANVHVTNEIIHNPAVNQVSISVSCSASPASHSEQKAQYFFLALKQLHAENTQIFHVDPKQGLNVTACMCRG